MKEYVPPKEPAEGKIGWDETWDLRTVPQVNLKSEWARRSSLSRKIFSGGHTHEEGKGNSKLTVARLQKARREWLAGVSIASIAKDEGIHYTTLYRALYGKTWKKRYKTPKSVR